jgi:hypothetical protein
MIEQVKKSAKQRLRRWGLYKLNAVLLTHSLKAPGFNHRTYQLKIENLVSKFALSNSACTRYTQRVG